MTSLYHDEKDFLDKFRKKVSNNDSFSQDELLEIANRFDEMIEMTTVTVKIIDRLMINHDRLKQKESNYASIKKP